MRTGTNFENISSTVFVVSVASLPLKERKKFILFTAKTNNFIYIYKSSTHKFFTI